MNHEQNRFFQEMKRSQKILVGMVGIALGVFFAPIVWFAFGTHGYFAGRCQCGYPMYHYLENGSPASKHYARVYNVWEVWIARHMPTHGPAQRISCINNLKQIGIAFRIWAGDNDDRFPFNLSTNAGGTLEFCRIGKDGFDLNGPRHLQVMSNELNTPKILVCPEDKSRKPAPDFGHLHSTNVTYLVRSGTNLSDANPKAMLAICPIDGNIVYCDGTVSAK